MGRTSKYMTAKEAEMEMNEARKVRNLTGNIEEAIVSNMVENAKMSSMIGDKLQIVINPVYIHIPEWQRRIDITRAMAIGTGYNKYKWDVPKVLYNKGKLWVIDGQHRIYGAFKANKTGVVVEILECSMEEAIKIFINQSNDRKRMSPSDVYFAALEAKDEVFVKLSEVCHKHGVAIKGEYLPNAVGTYSTIKDVITGMPIETVDKILGLLGKLQWNGYADTYNGRAYGAKFIRAFRALYGYYNGRTEEMENIIIKNCKGTEWFVNNVMDMAQGQVFDYLSAIVQHDMKSPFKVVKKGRAV